MNQFNRLSKSLNKEILAQQIVELRTERNLTQAEFAKKVGVGRPMVSRWENGHTIPRGRCRERIARIAGTTWDQLVASVPLTTTTWEVTTSLPDDARTIRDFPGYVVTKAGQVLSGRRGRDLKQMQPWQGVRGDHLRVRLRKENGDAVVRRVCDLVAEHFLPQPGLDTVLEFKSGDRTDVGVENLVWRHREAVHG